MNRTKCGHMHSMYATFWEEYHYLSFKHRDYSSQVFVWVCKHFLCDAYASVGTYCIKWRGMHIFLGVGV